MSNLNEGIRTLSNNEIAAVAGAGAVCSPQTQQIRAVLDVIGCRPCSPVASSLAQIYQSVLCSLRYPN